MCLENQQGMAIEKEVVYPSETIYRFMVNDRRLPLESAALLVLAHLNVEPGFKLRKATLLKLSGFGKVKLKEVMRPIIELGYARVQVEKDRSGRIAGRDYILRDPVELAQSFNEFDIRRMMAAGNFEPRRQRGKRRVFNLNSITEYTE